ncbi:MAG TPA: efflux RND transporter periplasmic adaptor subunit [Anaeromyxobacter sp.]|nr:efflux RND transporter periplasmic adaptor subunit [Anaeromyxobacter sp.]
MTTKTKLWIASIAGLLATIVLLGGVKAAQIGTMIAAGKKFTVPPEAVTSARVEATQWEASRSAIGTLVAVHAVTLSAEVTGRVTEIGFESGALLRKGTLCVKLDTSAEEAQLASAQADAALARLNLERALSLRQGEANTQADLDAAQARAKQADAAVANLAAVISKKTIRAPFDGRISIRQVELGQILSPGTPIATLQSVSPIYAEFTLPQQALAEIRVGQKARVQTDIFPNASWEGEVTTINPEVDTSTRNVRVRGTFQNQDGRLRPGMFVSVDVISSERHPVTVIPATAVIYAPYGDSVFTIEEEKGQDGKATTVARQRFVRLGERRGDFVAVVSGLEPGERVVSNGAFKLRNGAAVAVNDALAPPAELAPRPADR